MKRRRILLLLALAVVAAAIFICWPRGPKEPVYQGRRLSQWIEKGYDGDPEAREIKHRALKAMGTNALPYLLSQFARKNARWSEGIKQWAHSHRILRHFRSEQERLYAIDYGLHLLGPDAAPGLPALARYLDDLDDPTRGRMAASVMWNCGAPALPYLLQALDSTNPEVCGLGFGGIVRLSGETNVLPIVIRLMNHSNVWVRWRSATELANYRSQPDLVVPPLIRALSDPDPQVQYAAIGSLDGLGSVAKSAIPELLRLMNDPASKSTLAASNAVFHIDPAALSGGL